MLQVDQYGQGVANNSVRRAAGDVHDEAKAHASCSNRGRRAPGSVVRLSASTCASSFDSSQNCLPPHDGDSGARSYAGALFRRGKGVSNRERSQVNIVKVANRLRAPALATFPMRCPTAELTPRRREVGEEGGNRDRLPTPCCGRSEGCDHRMRAVEGRPGIVRRIRIVATTAPRPSGATKSPQAIVPRCPAAARKPGSTAEVLDTGNSMRARRPRPVPVAFTAAWLGSVATRHSSTPTN